MPIDSVTAYVKGSVKTCGDGEHPADKPGYDRLGSKLTTLDFLTSLPPLAKYLSDSKDQCNEPTIQSANPLT